MFTFSSVFIYVLTKYCKRKNLTVFIQTVMPHIIRLAYNESMCAANAAAVVNTQ